MFKCICAALMFVVTAAAAPARAQTAQESGAFGPSVTVCGSPAAPPLAQPPANSGPVVYLLVPCFEVQGNKTLVDPETYLYYIQLKTSEPSKGIWVPWNEETERAVKEDFR